MINRTIPIEDATPDSVAAFGAFVGVDPAAPVFAEWEGVSVLGPVPVVTGEDGELLHVQMQAAVIRCVLTEVGGVDGCKVVSEEPQGFGFGDAAVQLSKSFRMKAKTENDKPIAGAEVTIPVAFRPARPVPSLVAQ
jgi:TonB family protein